MTLEQEIHQLIPAADFELAIAIADVARRYFKVQDV